jgi:hypothetical protein
VNKKQNNIRIKGLLPLFFLLTFFACKKESTDIGVNFLPDGGNINSITESLSGIICRTIAEDSLRSDTLNTNILGAINDPIFGSSSASLIIQPLLSEAGDDLSGKTLDSIKLRLKFDKAQIIGGVENLTKYGDLNSTMEIEVYKLDEVLVAEDKYYSDYQPSLGDLVGSFTGKFEFFDSIMLVTNGDTTMEAPELSIALNNSFGQDILDKSGLVFNSADDWLDYLKGLVLVPKTSNLSIGEGAFVGIEASNTQSKMVLYYEDSLTREVPLGPASERINFYNYDNQSVDITSQKMSTGHYDQTYLQSLGGAKVKVDIPELSTLIEKGEKIVINEAVLSVSVVSTTENYPAPSRIILFKPNEAGLNAAIIDYIDDIIPPSGWFGYTNYGGAYNNDEKNYEFHFNRHLQGLIDEYIETETNEFDGFYLAIPSDFPITPSRAVLNTDSLNGGIKVSVTYTKLN